ncbi:hypothetical protein JCM8097_006492 [Rhodosporidiobolus ruineniae]
MLLPALPSTLAAVVALLPLLHSVQSASVAPPPLHPRALSHPQDTSIHLIPRHPDRPSSISRLARRAATAAGQEDQDEQRRLTLRSDVKPDWDDRFLLSFLLPAYDSQTDDAEVVTLSLRPAANLVPRSGIKSTTRSLDEQTGEWVSTEHVVRREDIRAYEGWVVPEDEDVERWVREEIAGVVRHPDSGRAGDGWARIVLVDDEADGEPRFQGAFERKGEQYSVHSLERYLRTRDALDPEPPVLPPRWNHQRRAFGGEEDEPRHPRMVVVKERHILSREERVALLQKRGLPLPPFVDQAEAQSCSHDQLAFNADPAHPVLRTAFEQGLAGSSSPFTSPANSTSPSSSSLFSHFLSPRHPHLPFSPFDHTSSSALSSPYSPAYPHNRRAARELEKRQGDDISGGSGSSSNFINSIGSTAGCPKQAMVVFVGVAADCTYVSSYGSTEEARTQILTDMNSVSALYQTSFNVSLGIVELAVMNTTCPTTSSQVDSSHPWNLPCPTTGSSTSGSSATTSSIGIDLNSRLSVFSQWRGDKGASDGAGLWHLLTACQTGSEVGVAWLGQLCRVTATSSGGQTTCGTAVTAITRSEWQVMAHEIGHNFGAIHDCASGCSLSGSCCPLSTSSCNANADFIMSPVSEKNVSSFSPCSIGNICTALSSSLNTTCLATPGEEGNPNVISLQSCGNGILEDGEECDPGSDTTSNCCDASTCKFVSGAVCDPRNSLCCTSACQIAGNGTVCRASVDSRCDKEETCSGSSADCPEDEYEKDGKGCGDGLSCASGVCTSRDLQCRNAGASLNLTSACPTSANTGCSITCRDPTSSNSCIILDQSFRDGTSCGYGGRCEGGSCKSGSALDTAKSWYTNNLRISIPVTVVVGIIVLLLLWAIIRCLFCGGCRGRRKYKPPKNAAYSNQYAAAPPPQQQMQYNNGYYPPPSNGYGGNYGGGGGGGYAPPPGPPPSHPSLQQPQNAYRR